MNDVTEWLRLLIEARKATAEGAASSGAWGASGSADWRVRADESDHWLVQDGNGDVVVYDEGAPTEEQAEHITLNDPRQIIADCEADLAILDDHASVEIAPGDVRCGRCAAWCDHLAEIRGAHPQWGRVGVAAPAPFPCRTVRLLAWGYRCLDPAGYAAVAGDWTP